MARTSAEATRPTTIGFRSNATVSANSSAGSSSNKARDNSPETDARIRVEVWSSPTARDLSWTEMIFFVQENIGYPWAEKNVGHVSNVTDFSRLMGTLETCPTFYIESSFAKLVYRLRVIQPQQQMLLTVVLAVNDKHFFGPLNGVEEST